MLCAGAFLATAMMWVPMSTHPGSRQASSSSSSRCAHLPGSCSTAASSSAQVADRELLAEIVSTASPAA